jgi:hypothetical protein
MTTPGSPDGAHHRPGHGQESSRRGEPPSPAVPFRPPVFLPWALAAGFAALTIWLGQALLTTRKEAESQQTEARLNELALRESRNQMEAERIVLDRRLTDATKQLAGANGLANLRITALLPGSDAPASSLAVAVWDPLRQEGVLALEKLPAPPADQDYQLWLVDSSGQHPAKGGVFAPNADGGGRIVFKSERTLSAVSAFVITRERKGGAAKPEGPSLLRSK